MVIVAPTNAPGVLFDRNEIDSSHRNRATVETHIALQADRCGTCATPGDEHDQHTEPYPTLRKPHQGILPSSLEKSALPANSP